MPRFGMSFGAKELAKTRFRGFNLTLAPAGGTVTLPQHASSTVRDVMQGARVSGFSSGVTQSQTPPMPFPPALFRPASSDPSDASRQRTMHEAYQLLFDRLSDAIDFAVDNYKLQAGMRDVVINGLTANGGRLEGPPLDGFIRTAPQVASLSGWMAMVRDAVAAGIGKQWAAYTSTVRVPGLPWYPSFVAFPAPQAPPMPNIPSPLVLLGPNLSAIQPEAIKVAMLEGLQGKQMEFGNEFFLSLGTGFQTAVLLWQATQMVTLVMGKGPVPSFAPPYVPVGPVVGGDIIPGNHLMT
jgi:hypothetical protein